MKNLIFITFLVFSNTMFSQGWINITATGSWTKTFVPSDIIEAGNDYKTSFESDASQTKLTIYPNNKTKWVNVYVARSNIDWHSNLQLKVRRTSNGNNTNNLTISADTGYHYITNQNTVFFTFKGYPTEVPLQYEITGISVLLPVTTYSTTITYTVMYED